MLERHAASHCIGVLSPSFKVKEQTMDEVKVTVDNDGHPVIGHSESIEQRCNHIAQAIAALADSVAAADSSTQRSLMVLLRTLTHEQLALTAALGDHAGEFSSDEANRRTYRRAFRKGYSAGLQRTLPARQTETVERPIKSSGIATKRLRQDALRNTVLEH